jgi:putative addiction module component (TIGR02574 family)
MAHRDLLKAALALPIAERIKLVQDIWDSVAICPEAIPVTKAQRKLLDERLRQHRASPESARPWPEVKAAILRKPRRK